MRGPFSLYLTCLGDFRVIHVCVSLSVHASELPSAAVVRRGADPAHAAIILRVLL